MKGLLQRVRGARVEVAGEIVGAVDQGLLVLVAVEPDDTRTSADKLLHKLLNYRVFSDAEGKMNLSLADVRWRVAAGLSVHPGCRHQERVASEFLDRGPSGIGRGIVRLSISQAKQMHGTVASGRFGADMQVHLVNDGPVTFLLQT